MSKHSIWKSLGLAAVATLALGFFCGSGRATALNINELSSVNSIKAKVALEGMYQCFNNGAYQSDWKASTGGLGFLLEKEEGLVKLPYGWWNDGDIGYENSIDCKKIMQGGWSSEDDLSRNGLVPESIKNGSISEVTKFFAGPNKDGRGGAGYFAVPDEDDIKIGQETQQLTMTIVTEYNGQKQQCLNTSGQVESVNIKLVFPMITAQGTAGTRIVPNSSVNVPAVGSGDLYKYLGVCGETLYVQDQGSIDGKEDQIRYLIEYGDFDFQFFVETFPQAPGEYTEWVESKEDNNDDGLPDLVFEGYNRDGSGYSQFMYFTPVITEGKLSDQAFVDEISDYRLYWDKDRSLGWAIEGFNTKSNTGYKLDPAPYNWNGLTFADQEVYDLYRYYITDVYNVPVVCEGENSWDIYKNKTPINWKPGVECRADIEAPGVKSSFGMGNPDHVYGLASDNHFTAKVSLDDIIERLKKVNLNLVEDPADGGTIGLQPSPDPDPGSTPGSQDADVCYEGAGVLGWIVCPITSGLTSVGESLYNWVEEDFLQVRASIFTDSKNGVEEVWGTVRNIANIGFIIMFLIVIVSQVTGYGIDNYGIKRILPKLIIGAIVMNLSYVICELMIDASNIAGSGLKDLLTNMAPPLEMESAVNSSYSASMAQYVIVGGGAIAGGAAILLLSSGGMGLILMLLIALLVVVISLVVLFVTLVVRQAGIVICVIIAPIAVLCYLLPNMEKYSKKWLSLMKGLLLVYPLCGLMIGAGNLMGHVFGNLAVNNGNMQAGFALSAMVVTAIPYLFVPTLLKSSLAAMGNLGAKISGFGSKMRGGASRKIKGSNAMKNSRERAGEFRTRIRAGVDKDGNVKNVGRFGKAIRGGNRGMARARAQYLKNRDTRNREDNLMGVGFMAAQVAQEKKATADEIANELTLLKSETNDGADENKVIETFNDSMERANRALAEGNEAEASKYINKARAAVQLAGRRKDTAARFAEATLLNDKRQYNSALLGKIAKDISEGETSKSYRSGSPFAFEYASRLNDGTAVGADGKTPAKDFTDWLANPNNVHNALDRHVATSEDLMNVQGANLRQMADMIEAREMDGKDAEYLRTLSQKAIIAHKEKGASFDYSKAEQIYRLAYGDEEYKSKMEADKIAHLIKGGGAQGAALVPNVANGGTNASELNVRAAVSAQQTSASQGGGSGNGLSIDVKALGDETLLDIATNPNSSMDDATRTAAENEYYKRVATSATQRPQVAPSPDSGVPTELPPPNLPPEPPQPAPPQSSQPGNNA